MAVTNPPLWLEASTQHHARTYRRALLGILNEGVAKNNSTNDMAVTNPSGTTLRVAKGGAFVKGTDVTDQGTYYVFNDANYDLSITAPGANSRIDAVVVRVKDNADGTTAGDTATIELVAGTADPSPTPPSIPTSSYRLANVTITSASAITIADTRAAATFQLAAGSTAGVPMHDATKHTFIGARASRNAAAGPLSANTPAIIDFEVEQFDSSSIHSVSANTSKFTVPTGYGGIWEVKAQGVLDGDTSSTSLIGRIKLNGTTICSHRSTGVNDISVIPSTVYNAAAGDFFQFEMEADRSLDIFEGPSVLWMSVTYLGV